MDNTDPIELFHGHIPELVQICRDTGDILLGHWKDVSLHVHRKHDDSPVTKADLQAHDCIMEGLTALHKKTGITLPMLSEEGGIPGYEERQSWQTYWLIDPLDGTKSFIRGKKGFTVNIALIHHRVPVLGIIGFPPEDRFFYGTQGKGAFSLHGRGEPERLAGSTGGTVAASTASSTAAAGAAGTEGEHRNSLSAAPRRLRVIASKNHLDPVTKRFIKLVKKHTGPVDRFQAGSSLKFCMLAAETADLYPRFAPCMEWDTAAGDAVLRASGGSIVDMTTGNELIYNKPDLYSPPFLAFSKDGGIGNSGSELSLKNKLLELGLNLAAEM